MCTHAGVCLHVCVSVCVEVTGQPRYHSTFYLRQGLSLAGNFTKSVRQAAQWAPGNPPASTSHLASNGIPSMYHHTQLSAWALRIRLGPSGLQGKPLACAWPSQNKLNLCLVLWKEAGAKQKLTGSEQVTSRGRSPKTQSLCFLQAPWWKCPILTKSVHFAIARDPAHLVSTAWQNLPVCLLSVSGHT